MIRRLAPLLTMLLLLLGAPLQARADITYTICRNQTYALCASASSFVYGDVSYAKCIIKRGNSISAPPLYYQERGQVRDICNMNAQGVRNGYMMSTFSLPREVLPGGNKALYTCPTGSTASYAQCDGGTCFKSSTGRYFPGVGKVAKDEIVCSCPITAPSSSDTNFSFQFIGKYPCDPQEFNACSQSVSNGSIIPVGSPPGAGEALSTLLYGRPFPNINRCFPQQ